MVLSWCQSFFYGTNLKDPCTSKKYDIDPNSTLIMNGVVHKVDRERFRALVEEDVITAQVDLHQGTSIGEGTYGKVLKCPINCLLATGQRKTFQIAIKVLNVEYTQTFLKESLVGEIASRVSNVAAGVILIKQTKFYLFEKLYDIDAHFYSLCLSYPCCILTQERTVGFLADVLKGAMGLEKLHIFHVDQKPANVFIDKFRHMHLGDLGGALYFPPLDELTPELLSKQLFIFSESFYPTVQGLVSEFSEKIAQLDIRQKIYLIVQCQTLVFECPTTKNMSSLKLQNEIEECFRFFQNECMNSTFSDEEFINKYELMRKYLSSQMVFQNAVTYLCSINYSLNRDLIRNRMDGIFTGVGDPFSFGRIKQITAEAQVFDPRISQLLFQMLQSEQTHNTSANIYAQFLQIQESLQEDRGLDSSFFLLF